MFLYQQHRDGGPSGPAVGLFRCELIQGVIDPTLPTASGPGCGRTRRLPIPDGRASRVLGGSARVVGVLSLLWLLSVL